MVALPSDDEVEEEEEIFEDDEIEEEEEAEIDYGGKSGSKDDEDDDEDGDGEDDDDAAEEEDVEVGSGDSDGSGADDDYAPTVKKLRPADDGDEVDSAMADVERKASKPPVSIVSSADVTESTSSSSTSQGPFDISKLRRNYVLHDACEAGDVAFLREAFARDEFGNFLPHVRDLRVDARDLDGSTPLHVALLNGHLECAKILLEAGAEVLFRCEGSTSLHIAVSMGSFATQRSFALQAVELLLAHDANPNATDDLGRTPLHLCAQFGLDAVARALLSAPNFSGRDTKDKEGNTALHTAAQFGATAVAEVLLDVVPAAATAAAMGMGIGMGSEHDLLAVKVSASSTNLLSATNKCGFTALHTAAYYHGRELMALYPSAASSASAFAAAASATSSSSSPSSTSSPASPSASSPGVRMLKMLAARGLSFQAKDMLGRTPYDWAIRNASTGHGDSLASTLTSTLTASSSSTSSSSSSSSSSSPAPVLVSWSPECFDHYTAPTIGRRREAPPPENVRRLRVLMDPAYGILRADEFSAPASSTLSSTASQRHAVAWQSSAPPAAMVDVLRCHEYSYIHRLKLAAQSVEASSAAALASARAVNPSAAPQSTCLSYTLSGPTAPRGIPNVIEHLDGDTALSAGSYRAAFVSAGMVTDAVDKVLNGTARTAFCLVRPPGHHAGPTGVVHASEEKIGSSHGFCLLNNIAIGAAYARCVYRHSGIKRIAIVDFDVHHGNGTEAIVRNLAPSVSITRLEDEFMSSMVIRRQTYKPWLNETDADDVFFASVHGLKDEGPWFYPGSGPTTVGVVAAVDARVSNADTVPPVLLPYSDPHAVEPATVSAPVRPHAQVLNVGMGAQRPTRLWRQAWRHAILPKILQHEPDIIFISAGFDAHKRDDINVGYLGVNENDYYWLTKQLMKVANTTCGGRIVSALEGGYRIHGKVVSPFGRSVAAHVRALAEGCTEKWDPAMAAFERAQEDAEEEAIRQQALAAEAQRMAAIAAAMRPATGGEQTELASSSSSSSSSSTPSAPSADSTIAPAPVEGGRPKRQRAPVDYVALNAELERQKEERKKAAAAAAAAAAAQK